MNYTSKNFRIKVKYNTATSVQIKEVKSIFLSRGELIVDTGEMFLRPESQEDVELLMASDYRTDFLTTIWEGDIIQNLTSKELVVVKYNVGDMFVVYNPECCRYCKDDKGCIMSLEDWYHSNCHEGIDVVGNIYENYELLIKQEAERKHKHGN